MKKIIEICGIDTSGKTTQTNLLSQMINLYGVSNQIVPKILQYNPRVPKNGSDRQKWYKEASLDEILLAKLETLKEKSMLAEQMDAEIIIEDRGYTTIYSSCIAHCMQRAEYCFQRADSYVSRLNHDIRCVPIEDLHIILRFDNPNKNRYNKEMPEGFLQYLINFHLCIDEVSKRFLNTQWINAELPKEEISQRILDKIRGLNHG